MALVSGLVNESTSSKERGFESHPHQQSLFARQFCCHIIVRRIKDGRERERGAKLNRGGMPSEEVLACLALGPFTRYSEADETTLICSAAEYFACRMNRRRCRME